MLSSSMLGQSQKPSPPTTKTLAINIFLCVAIASFFSLYGIRKVTRWPFAIEAVWQCGLTEWNRRKGLARLRELKGLPRDVDPEKAPANSGLDVQYMGSVVGYHEDPTLWRKCLESYRPSTGLKLLLVGIDGNEEQDMEMVRMVETVFPSTTRVIPVDESFGFLALRLAEAHAFGSSYKPAELIDHRLDDFAQLPAHTRKEAEEFAMAMAFKKAHDILTEHGVLEGGLASDGMQVICFHQPHVCKKDIMFTNMVFSIVLGKARNMEYLWTSDSDTTVLPNTLQNCIGAMCLDPTIGGSCVTLGIHNAHDNWVSSMGAAAYWGELAITRSQTGSIDAVDCQPGPCATFKIDVLEPIIFDWYTQTSLGIRTVVNEDRHLTTQILLAGYKVTFLSSALALTETPTTLIRWLLQQLRWARASQIERFQYPWVYAIHGPVLFVNAICRFYGPINLGFFTVRYIWDGMTPYSYSWMDIAFRAAMYTMYNATVNPIHINDISWVSLLLSQIFYQLPLPGVLIWSSLTALQSSWGTQMRVQGPQGAEKKEKHEGWDNIGAVVVMTTWMSIVAAAFARYFVSRWAPEMVGVAMKVAGLSMAVILGWALLRKETKIAH